MTKNTQSFEAFKDLEAYINEKMAERRWWERCWDFLAYRAWRNHNPKEYYRRVKHFIQRGRRGYSDEDVWGLHYHLSEVLYRSLTDLRNNIHSYPLDFQSSDEWKAVLDEMIEGFYLDVLDDEWQIEDIDERMKEYKRRERKLQRSLTLLKKYYGDLWD